MLDQVRDIGCAQKGEPKLILRVAGLRLSFAVLMGKGVAFSAEFPPVQKKAPWGWLGLKPRKLPKPPSAAASPPPPPKPPPPPTLLRLQIPRLHRNLLHRHGSATAGSTSSGSAALSTSALRATLASTAGERLIQLCVLAKLLHVHPGEGIGRACLSGDRDRLGGEIRVIGESKAGLAPVAPLLIPASSAAPARPASKARFWAPPPVLRRTVPAWRGPEAGAPATFCCGVSGGTREARVSAKSACWLTGEVPVGLMQRDLGFRGKSGEFGLEHVPAIGGNGHRVVAVDVRDGGVALAGQRIGGDDAHPGQGNVARFHRAVHQPTGEVAGAEGRGPA